MLSQPLLGCSVAMGCPGRRSGHHALPIITQLPEGNTCMKAEQAVTMGHHQPCSSLYPKLSSARYLHILAWVQACFCAVCIVLLLASSNQQETLLQQQQQQQQNYFLFHQHPASTSTIKLQTSSPRSFRHCWSVMICSLLSRLHSTSTLHQQLCERDSRTPATDQAGLLPCCAMTAAKYLLLMVEAAGLLLAVVLLYLTWPALKAVDVNSALVVNHQDDHSVMRRSCSDCSLPVYKLWQGENGIKQQQWKIGMITEE